MLPLKRIIIHRIHLQVIDHLVLGMDHLLQTTTHSLLLPLHTRTRDIVIYQLDLRLRIIMLHPPRHLTHLPPVDIILLLITHRQLVVGIIRIQILHRVTEVLRLRIPLLAMEHHPQIPLMVTTTIINLLPRHIILILNTVNPPIMDTTPLPLQEDTPNPHLQDTHSLLLHPTIQPHKGIDRMYLLLLIHDDHLLLRRDKGSIDPHLKGRDRVVKWEICWLDLYVPLSFAVIRWLMYRIRTDKDRTRRRRN
jgi:hypothetical protein